MSELYKHFLFLLIVHSILNWQLCGNRCTSSPFFPIVFNSEQAQVLMVLFAIDLQFHKKILTSFFRGMFDFGKMIANLGVQNHILLICV